MTVLLELAGVYAVMTAAGGYGCRWLTMRHARKRGAPARVVEETFGDVAPWMARMAYGTAAGTCAAMGGLVVGAQFFGRAPERWENTVMAVILVAVILLNAGAGSLLVRWGTGRAARRSKQGRNLMAKYEEGRLAWFLRFLGVQACAFLVATPLVTLTANVIAPERNAMERSFGSAER